MKDKKVTIYECNAGDIIARNVIDIRSGITLCQEGHVLTEQSIEWLKRFMCSDIYIESNTWDKVWHIPAESKVSYEQDKEKLQKTLSAIGLGEEIDKEAVEEIKTTFFTKLNSNSTIMGCVNVVKTLDEYTYTHSLNVGMLSVLIGKWMGLKEEQLEELFLAGVLHDAGKYKVNQNVLNKKGELNSLEYLIVKRHATESYNLIKDVDGISNAVKEGVLSHHERIDGTGYPRELKGDEIHLYGRILAIADTYDAMISERVYKTRQTPFEVMEKMLSEGIDKLDTQILLLFLKNMADYYIGVQVTLNTGEVGEVVFMHPHCIYRPIIKVAETYYDLDRRTDLEIVEMIS
ncbi:HD-GYP domain-containing protein [Niameybacter massiliensis]|uniref:HD-GYP domain-containing protein n=1 Tax=Niameybacter massiliensis TaxID=1658108 RepID=UPI0006B3FF5A|nr:HD-GYP domain-containing protein [Niameybacter massiliensis]